MIERTHKENYLKISDNVQKTAASTIAVLEATYVLLSETLLIDDISEMRQSIKSMMYVMENATEEEK